MSMFQEQRATIVVTCAALVGEIDARLNEFNLPPSKAWVSQYQEAWRSAKGEVEPELTPVAAIVSMIEQMGLEQECGPGLSAIAEMEEILLDRAKPDVSSVKLDPSEVQLVRDSIAKLDLNSLSQISQRLGIGND